MKIPSGNEARKEKNPITLPVVFARVYSKNVIITGRTMEGIVNAEVTIVMSLEMNQSILKKKKKSLAK